MCQRKCDCCKNEIELVKNSDNIIYFDNKFYHKQCFIDTCERKKKRSSASPKWGLALDNIDNVIQSSKDKINNDLTKDEIIQFISDFYDIKVIPKRTFQRLSDIYSGSYVGMTVGIPPVDLLDMWKRKQNELNSIHMKNQSVGKSMDSSQMIHYDLAVLVNKYDSYLRWKEKQKIIERDSIEVHSKILKDVDLKMLGTQVVQQKNQSADVDDMDELLDELFD